MMERQTGENAVRDWRYFAEALAWYEPRHGLTGAQVFGVVQQVQQALAEGRITPADLGIEPDAMATCPKCRCLVNSPCPTCGAPMILVSENMAICDTFHCFKPVGATDGDGS